MKIFLLTKWFFAVGVAIAITGCATEKINWQSRIGNYTYDQAVREFGQPDKQEKFPDGTAVADWMVAQNHPMAAPEPLAPPNGFGPATPAYNQTFTASYYMRLTFDAGGELRDFKNISR